MAEVDTTTERWLPVVGFENSYEVSDLGRIQTLTRTVGGCNDSRRTLRGMVLKPVTRKNGYQSVSLWRERKQLVQYVHVLVLTAFDGPPEPGQECRHGDDVRHHNHLTNLCWGTRSENQVDRVERGHHYLKERKRCPREHLLVEPNLVAHKLADGWRNCLSCNRAQSLCRYYAHKGVWLDLGAESDRYYEQLQIA